MIILLSFSGVFAQAPATIRGFVYDKSNGEPVIFTNVYLKGTTLGAATDVNGYFNISGIPPGNYILTITYLGLDTIKEAITLKAGEMVTKKIFMNKATTMLKIFSVIGGKQDDTTETKISVQKITPRQISSIPSIGAPDLAQYLQVIPGVIFTGDQGGQLYIRGGAPIQNKVLLDGMVIYNPFHSIGLFSVFETEIIRNADVYTGGFNADYGGRISSVMDITTRDGNKTRYSGVVAGSPFGTNLIFEGPIVKQKEKGGSISFLLAGKNSFLKESSKIFYEYIDSAGLPFNFRDIYGKVSLNGDNGSKINFFGFNFTDNVIYREIAKFNWKANGIGSNFVVIPGNSPTLIEGILAYSDYDITLTDPSNLPKNSSINGFNFGLNFTYFPGKNQVKWGVEFLGYKTNFQFYNAIQRLIQQSENTTELAGFVKYKFTPGKFIIEPGFRLHYYASQSEISPEPRFAIKYVVTPNIRVKAAGGLYAQNLMSASSDRDVVNLFYGFLSGPDNLQDQFMGKEVTSRLQKGQHVVVGIEFTLLKNIALNIEGYYKNFSQLTNMNRNKVFEDNGDYYDKPDYLKKDFIIEKGNAKGVDVSIKFENKHFYFWTAYSLGFVHRNDGYVEYVPHYDRRHNLNLLTTYRFGANNKNEISVRWNFGSGFPFTQNGGFYPLLTFEDGIESDVTNADQYLGILYSDINKGRLPYYHRLDINVKRTFYLSEQTKLELSGGVTNAYDRKNIFYFDRITNARIDQLPIMPSVTALLRF